MPETEDEKRIELRFAGLEFPKELQNRKANFRLVVCIRFCDRYGNLKTENAVVPGLDTYWECDTGEKEKYNYVRKHNKPAVDINKIHVWDKLILCVVGRRIHSALFTVVDVDRKDWLERVGRFLGRGMLQLSGSSDTYSAKVSTPLGAAADNMKSAALTAGGTILFRHSIDFSEPVTGNKYSVEGRGEKGTYNIHVELVMADNEEKNVSKNAVNDRGSTNDTPKGA